MSPDPFFAHESAPPTRINRMEIVSEIPTPNDRRALRVRAAAVGLCAFAALLATSPQLPIVWDEGNAISRAQRITGWAQSWFQQGPPDRAHPLSREGIADGWPYTTQIEGHPAFYGIVIAAGHTLSQLLLPPLTAWRLGPMLLFALAAGAMFYRMSRDYGQAAGWAAALALFLQPRLFAHGHFATCDGPLTACWILAWAAFPSDVAWLSRAEPKKDGNTLRLRIGLAPILFGIFLGMTMSTKATGWIAPIPFVVWAALYRDRRAQVTLAIGLPVALATFYLLNPPLWHEPIRGLATFFHLNTNRQLNVANFFLGCMYDLRHPLPWYNTLVWTAVAVPVGLLALALVGLTSILRRGLADRAGILLILNWIILLVVRALPDTPPHDGIRLFLPAFAFLAALVAVGVVGVQASACRSWRKGGVSKRRAEARTPTPCATACLPSSASPSKHDKFNLWHCLASKQWHTWAVVLIFLGSATSLFWYAPQWLSYYNLVIGGLPGATRVGMEPTYYWDSLDREVLDWLRANTPKNEKVLFGSGSVESLALMRTWGTLPVEYRPEAPGRCRWYVIQRRPSACMPPDQWLLRNAQPVYKKYLHHHGLGPWRFNVPLLEIYRYEDYQAAVESLEGGR